MKLGQGIAAIAMVMVLGVLGCARQATPSPSPVTPPPVPHTLEGRSECLLCHSTGIASSPAVPEYHRGLDNEACLACHKQGRVLVTPLPPTTPTPGVVTPSPTAGPTPTPIEPSATPTPPGPTPTPTPAEPVLIPHPLLGREDCLACHGSGLSGVPQVPADHTGRSSQTCTLCHKEK